MATEKDAGDLPEGVVREHLVECKECGERWTIGPEQTRSACPYCEQMMEPEFITEIDIRRFENGDIMFRIPDSREGDADDA